jgi:hypothetical protein
MYSKVNHKLRLKNVYERENPILNKGNAKRGVSQSLEPY